MPKPPAMSLPSTRPLLLQRRYLPMNYQTTFSLFPLLLGLLLALLSFLRFSPSCASLLLALLSFLRFSPSCASLLLALLSFLRFSPSCASLLPSQT
ncbi:hypothetical protein K505DRAFT_124159 [Melanomma pulvis-pyrius CBS 109.77]|uniref:Uncharacterized protein n=1 Tax=Melanomma pulvis-pyrius CBS 109.77 TaxID=1314802 RepID=A0A6A6WUP7_9PLEO|nr:hypothetical protein K505DRAFT_124159 [Melanomma pulvis-pyrius CBS 109.77]